MISPNSKKQPESKNSKSIAATPKYINHPSLELATAPISTIISNHVSSPDGAKLSNIDNKQDSLTLVKVSSLSLLDSNMLLFLIVITYLCRQKLVLWIWRKLIWTTCTIIINSTQTKSSPHSKRYEDSSCLCWSLSFFCTKC